MHANCDVSVSSDGSVYLFYPNSPAALAWLDDNVHPEGWQWLGRAFAVEQRFVGALIEGMVADGMRVEVRS